MPPRSPRSLRSLRIAAGLSQQALAERAGVDQTTVVDLEAGRRQRPHPATRKRIADALGVAVDDVRELAPGDGQGDGGEE